MPDNFTETLSFKITRERKLVKIAKRLDIPVSRAAIDNFIAWRKRHGGGYYLSMGKRRVYRPNSRKKEKC